MRDAHFLMIVIQGTSDADHAGVEDTGKVSTKGVADLDESSGETTEPESEEGVSIKSPEIAVKTRNTGVPKSVSTQRPYTLGFPSTPPQKSRKRGATRMQDS